MILGPKKLLQLVKTKKLVEGLAQRELTTPEGAGFDIQLGEVHKLNGATAYLGITHRETPKIKIFWIISITSIFCIYGDYQTFCI